MNKLYDLIKTILTEEPEMRNSDRKLIWRVWETQNVLKWDGYGNKYMTYNGFLDAENTETIRRTRQKIQEHCPDLKSCESVQKAKDEKRRTKGTFVYKVKFPTEAITYAQVKTQSKKPAYY